MTSPQSETTTHPVAPVATMSTGSTDITNTDNTPMNNLTAVEDTAEPTNSDLRQDRSATPMNSATNAGETFEGIRSRKQSLAVQEQFNLVKQLSNSPSFGAPLDHIPTTQVGGAGSNAATANTTLPLEALSNELNNQNVPFNLADIPVDVPVDGMAGVEMGITPSLGAATNGDLNVNMAANIDAAIRADVELHMKAEMEQQYWPQLQPEEPKVTELNGFAKLVFDDSAFYMTTLSVILGRDQESMRNLQRFEDEKRKMEAADASAFDTDNAQTPNRKRTSHSRPRHKMTCINASAGILDPWVECPSDGEPSSKRRKSKKAKSTNASSRSASRRNSLVPPAPFAVNSYIDPSAGVQAVNPASQKPSPNHCPRISIHPPFATGLQGFKAISREHARIYYDNREECFKVRVLGRNGLFVDDKFYDWKQEASLSNGSRLQIGFVYIRFLLPNVILEDSQDQFEENYDEDAVTRTYSESIRYSEGGKEMSLDFDEIRPRNPSSSPSSNGIDSDEGLDEDPDDEPNVRNNKGIAGEDDDGEDAEGEEVDESLSEEEIDDDDNVGVSPTDTSPKLAKKRGPGRPPKNGIMSKREQQLAKKKALEQKEAPQRATSTQPAPGTKNKVGRPRKHPLPDTPPEPRQKRKYTKRQPKEPKPVEEPKDTENTGDPDEDKFHPDGSLVVTKKTGNKPSYTLKEIPWRSEEECTPEQLAKPPKNYVQIVWEILTEEGIDLCLPQIYNEMEVRYPYFTFCKSKGWQSSVRHNLGQHSCFERRNRAGKGWAWSLKEGESYQKEKKRKPSSPAPAPAQANRPIFGNPLVLPQGVEPPPGYMIDYRGYQQPPVHPQYLPPGQQQQQQPYMGASYHPGPYPPPPHQGYPPPMNGALPQAGGPPPFIPPIPPQLAPSAPTSYSSPYAPKPNPSGAPPQNTQQQQLTPQQQPQRPPSQPQQLHQSPQANMPQMSAPPQSSDHPPPGPPPAQPQVPNQTPPAPPTANDQRRKTALHLINVFRTTLINTLKKTHADSEELVDSAMSRVFNGTDKAPDIDERQVGIIRGFRNMIETKTDLFPNGAGEFRPQQARPTSSANQGRTQDGLNNTTSLQQQARIASTGQETSAHMNTKNLMRPSLSGPSSSSGQNRVHGSLVPRPPLMMPGMGGVKRSNSGSGSAGQQVNGSANANTNGNTNAVSNAAANAGADPKPMIGNGNVLDANGNSEADTATSQQQQQQHSPQQPVASDGAGAVNEHESTNVRMESLPREDVNTTAADATPTPTPSAPEPMSDFKRSFNHAAPAQLST
ncbi:hypothetical protein ACMFMG_005128 [Clarireedia jacksonii]